MIPDSYRHLCRLYWQLRMRRSSQRPSRSTIYRQIADEKKRLHLAGVPHIEIHRVTRYLAQPDNPRMSGLLQDYLRDRAAGVSPWHAPSESRP